MDVYDAHISCSCSFLRNSAPHTERQLLYLWNEYGASPRALTYYARDLAIYEADVADQVWSMYPRALQYILNSPNCEDSSDLIVVVDPLPNSRLKCCKKIASQSIFEGLWDGRLVHPPSERFDLHSMFQNSEFTADTAGWFI